MNVSDMIKAHDIESRSVRLLAAEEARGTLRRNGWVTFPRLRSLSEKFERPRPRKKEQPDEQKKESSVSPKSKRIKNCSVSATSKRRGTKRKKKGKDDHAIGRPLFFCTRHRRHFFGLLSSSQAHLHSWARPCFGHKARVSWTELLHERSVYSLHLHPIHLIPRSPPTHPGFVLLAPKVDIAERNATNIAGSTTAQCRKNGVVLHHRRASRISHRKLGQHQ